MVTMSLHHSNHQNYDLQTFSRSQTPSSLIRRSFSSPALFPASLRNHGDSLAKIPPFFATSPLSPQFAPSYPLLHSLLTLPVPTTLLVSWTLTLPCVVGIVVYVNFIYQGIVSASFKRIAPFINSIFGFDGNPVLVRT